MEEASDLSLDRLLTMMMIQNYLYEYLASGLCPSTNIPNTQKRKEGNQHNDSEWRKFPFSDGKFRKPLLRSANYTALFGVSGRRITSPDE